MNLTVITATLPERAWLLDQLRVTLETQDVPPARWLIGVDTDRQGPVAVRNSLAQRVDTEWLFPLDDDDLLDRHHFATLAQHLSDEFDIVHTWCRIADGGDEHPAEQFQVKPNNEFGWQFLRERNWIPNAAAIRTEFFDELGGYRDVPNEDHDLWIRALDAGGRFCCVPEVTWTYRLNGEWAHRSAGACHAGTGRSPRPRLQRR